MASIQGTGLSVVEGKLYREVETLKKEKDFLLQEIQVPLNVGCVPFQIQIHNLLFTYLLASHV